MAVHAGGEAIQGVEEVWEFQVEITVGQVPWKTVTDMNAVSEMIKSY